MTETVSPGLAASLPTPIALIVAHPGHELRLHHFLETHHPTVLTLTDGSGREGAARHESSRKLIARTGASVGPIFGRFSDLDVYEHIRRGNVAAFASLRDEIAAFLREHNIACVVGDATEGHSTTHDLCRALIDSAVAQLRKSGESAPLSFDFSVVDRPDTIDADRADGVFATRLDDDAFARKLASAHGYPELAAEVGQAARIIGLEPFRHEILHRASDDHEARLADRFAAEPPPYEQYGQRLFDAGVYASVIRYGTHIRPIIDALFETNGAVDAA